MKRKLLLGSLICMCTLLSGCSKYGNVEKLSLVSPLSQQEIVDYYKNALEFSNISQHKTKTQTIQLQEVTDVEKENITNVYKTLAGQLSTNSYSDTYLMSEEQYNLYKVLIDDVRLSNAQIEKIQKYQEYYYATVTYDTSPNTTGTFKEFINYMGINGALKEYVNGGVYVDTVFMTTAQNKYNNYLKTLSKQNSIEISENIKQPIETQPENVENDNKEIESAIIETEENDDTNTNENKINVENVNETIENTENQEENEITTEQVQEEVIEKQPIIKLIPMNYRTTLYDISTFNKVAGSSATNTAFMPKLNYIYASADIFAGIKGNGIFPQGAFNLCNFNYDRNKALGKITITYIFKNDILHKNKIAFSMFYINNYNNTLSLDIDTSTIIPTFVETEIEKLLERTDRVIINKDIAGLYSKSIFTDVGARTLYSYLGANSNIYNIDTKLNKVLATNDKEYLIDVTRTIEISNLSANDTAIYKEDMYMVIKQFNLDFKIADFAIIKRECTKQPQPNLENLTQKRLAALNLKGEVSDTTKTEIQALLNNLYTASTERSLSGMYACYNDDTSLLSSERKEYLNAQLRSLLTKEGTNTKSTYAGTVSEWLGGNENQVEFIADETITYSGKNTKQIIQNYYLVSNYSGNWVIDDVKQLQNTTDLQ